MNYRQDVSSTRRWLNAYKLLVGCADCHTHDANAKLQFDHLPEHLKLANVSDLLHEPIQTLLNEMSKCEVVCQSCHIARTARRKASYITVKYSPAALTRRLAGASLPRRRLHVRCESCNDLVVVDRKPRRDKAFRCSDCAQIVERERKLRNWHRRKHVYRPDSRA